MGIPLETDSLDALPAHVRDLYVADGDAFRLDVEGVPDVAKLQSALRKEREFRSLAEKRLHRTSAGLADDATALFETERDKLTKAHAAELGKLQAAIDGAREDVAKARALALDARLQEAARASGIHSAAIADAVRAGRERFRVADDGSIAAVDGRQSVADWFRDMREDAPHWFPASGSGGGAQPGGSVASNTLTESQFQALSPAQRAAAMRAGYTIR